MKIYLVGGAVRDKLLGLPVKDRDYVVVGATPDDMIARGYKLVGADFPVFLHPDTKCEYALARTERKTGPGYKGFSVHAAPDVTLEQDLARRDLTINAMAESEAGELIDPYGGALDLSAQVLRHVSPAFVEDPLRVLRVARFAARFGFNVADETLKLMRELVAAGEMEHLVAERVWSELERALGAQQPWIFFEVLRACGALRILFPELEALFGVPQPERHHPEIDTGVHTLMALRQATLLSRETRVRFAVLVHDLGKGTTPQSEWPRHIGHEERGVKLIKNLCQRFRVPTEYRELAETVSRYHLHCHRALELRADTILKTLEGINAFRKPERVEWFVLACEADARGRKGLERRDYPQADLFRRAHAAARAIGSESASADAQGAEIGAQIRAHRIAAIADVRNSFPPPAVSV